MPKTTSTTVRVVINKEQSTQSKGQKAFNKLIEKIGKQRKSLAEWQATVPLYQQKFASKFHPLLLVYNDRRRELVHALDLAYDGKGLSKTDREIMSDLICSIAIDLIVEHGEESLKPIYNRHSGADLDAEAEQKDQAVKSMMESVLGIDLGDEPDFSSPEKMFAAIDEQLEKQFQEKERRQAANEARRSNRKKSAREVEKETRQQAEERDVSQSIRDVFRKLASALHPDREQDPAERERKTALMQKVNVAYGNRDLLQLLELQLEVEQIDQNAMNAVSEDRLKHYNKVLAEQSAELQQEIDRITFSYKAHANLPMGLALTPSKVMGMLQTNIREIEQHIAGLKQNIAACQNIKSLKLLLKMYREDRESSFDDDFF